MSIKTTTTTNTNHSRGTTNTQQINPTLLFNKIQKYSLTPETYSNLMSRSSLKSFDDFVERKDPCVDPAKHGSQPSNEITDDKYNKIAVISNNSQNTRKMQRVMPLINNQNTTASEHHNHTNNRARENNQETKTVKQYYSINVKDQLFWCLMMIVNSWDEDDLPEQHNRFEYESKQKTELTEMLQKNKDIQWKTIKISRSAATTGLGSSINGKIGFYELKALAYLFEKNIIYTWGKSYISIPGGQTEASDSKSDKWHVIFKKRDGYKLATDEYALEMMKQFDNNCFNQVNDPIKPLMAETTYKLNELQEMAIKFDIDIKRENQQGKNKTKHELYNEIINIIQKID